MKNIFSNMGNQNNQSENGEGDRQSQAEINRAREIKDQKVPEFKDYYKSRSKTERFVIKEPDILYTPEGRKQVKKIGINVKFENFRYTAKNDEEVDLLNGLVKRGIITKITSRKQKKSWDIEQAKKEAIAKVEQQYADEDKNEE